MEVLNIFNTLTLIQISWNAKTFFKKLEYRFLVETIKIEETSFPFKTPLSEANVKTNRMVTTKWTDHKEWSFASNYFIFSKILFQSKNLFYRIIRCTNYLNVHIHIFRKRWSFIWGCFFSVSILNLDEISWTKLLLHGDSKYENKVNKKILLASVNFVLSTKRFEGRFVTFFLNICLLVISLSVCLCTFYALRFYTLCLITWT